MSSKRTSLEIIAPTIEEAVTKGLSELGMSEHDVEVEVLDEGSRGLFGLGSRQSRIRLTIISTPEVKEQSPQKLEMDKPEIKSKIQPMEVAQEISSSDDLKEMEALKMISRDTVQELLERMGVKAEVQSDVADTPDNRGRRQVTVDISGNDLSILIGKQTETLNALQYIASLIIGKELGTAVSLVIDVEGYRRRREQQLRQLARRMADQAIKTGRRQVLEPMSSNERRLVHIELRECPDVETESIGEEPRRKVTIIPKENYRN